MADPRTFVLIGDFQDNITPALDGINNSIARLKQTMSTMTSKRGGGFSDVTQSVGKLVSSQKHLADSIKNVGDAAKVATGELKAYKNMAGKVASAHYHIAKAANQAGDKIASANSRAVTSIDRLDRREKLYASARRQRMRNLSSLGATSYSPNRSTTSRPAAAPRMTGGGGGRGVGYGGSFDMPAFAFGMTLGQGISQPITAAVLSGFQLGVGLLQQSFQYISSSFAERVEDQMSDLQAAGGYYSIAQRQKNPMFTSLQQSIMFTQRTNDVLERLAGDLPGKTEDYVKVSKRIGDSVMRLVDSNEKGSLEFARQLLATTNTPEGYRDVSLEGPRAREGALQVILGELTKKTVMAGFGGATGKGGATGNYGLPAQIEKLITNPDTTLASMAKYVSVSGDPKILSALERAMPELDKAGSDLLARAKVVNKLLDEIASPEMIAAMRKSMAGVLEAYRSAFFSPGTGLFGFGRKLKDASGKLQPLTDVYGRFIRTVEKNGKTVEQIVKTAEEADQVPMDVFNMFSDIITNYASILKPIVDNLYLIWDPLQGIADALRQARIISIEVLQTFRNYVAGLDKFAEGITDKGLKDSFLSTKNLRATLLTISNLFTELGIFSETDFSKYQKMIIDPKATVDDLGGVLKSFANTFFNSEAATEVGKFFGNILREVVIVLADITDFGKMLGKSNLASGFTEGFGEEGFKALERMFTNIYDMIFSAIAKAISSIPPSILLKIAGYALAGSLVVAGIAGLGMAIGAGVAGLLSILAVKLKERILGGGTLSKCLTNITGLMCGVGGGGAQGGRNKPGRRRGGSFFITPGGEKMATSIRQRGAEAKAGAKKYLTEPVVQPRRRIMPDDWFTKGPLPPVALGTEAAPYTKRQQVQRGAQALYQAPGKFASRVGAAPIAPTLQAMGGMFGGVKGGAARGMAKMGRFVPGGALAFGALDAGMRMASGEDAGRAIGGAAASTIGATLGGILGQTLIPIPGVGAALGTVAGGFIGDKIFNAVVPSAEEQKRAADLQIEAARMQQVVARANSGVDVAAAGGNQFNFGDPAQFSRYISMLGLQQDAQVKQFQGLYSLDQQKQNAAAELGKKYNEEVERLRKTGLSQQQIAKELAPLGKTFNTAKNEAQTSLTNLNKQWDKIGAESRTKILSGADNIAQALDDAAAKVRLAGDPARGNTDVNRRNNVGVIERGATRTVKNPDGSIRTEVYDGQNWNNAVRWKGGLGDAIASEMKHKPSGSDLVIANSSETVIPAAGGYGMQDFMGILSAGFTAINNQYKSLASGVNTLEQTTDTKLQQSETQNADRYQKTTATINNYHKENQQEFAKIGENILQLSQKVATMGSMGGMFGGGMDLGGGYGGAGVQIAGQLGNYIKATGGAPGSIWEHPMHGGVKGKHAPGSYHYSGRAIDIGAWANEQAGVIARIKQFNAKYGVKPVEFLHAGNDPNHQDHVHVAYAAGLGNPILAPTREMARQIDARALGRANIETYTAGKGEFGGGGVGTLNVAVYAGDTSDPDKLANIVAQRILTAMQNPDSIFI